jgi:ABC-type transport system involved in multi-copper enzyme maturation permease subunit
MRLLRAELHILARPLTWGLAATAALFCVLLAIGGAHNAPAANGTSLALPSCAQRHIPAGAACVRAMAAERARLRRYLAAARQVSGQLDPVAAGAEAAGLMASLPGALIVALLAGGHLGGEWSGRTIKNRLTQNGHRWQFLAAKLVSLWLAALAVLVTCWAALAMSGPLIVRLNHLPAAQLSIATTAGTAGSQLARALLVLTVFASIGLLAATITRGSIGTMSVTAGSVVAMIVLTRIPGVANWTPAVWVQGWMGFPVGEASITSLPTNFWSRFVTTTGGVPGQLAGLLGLVSVLAVCLAASAGLFQRSDVVG